jgi:hexosaminidase
VISEKLQSYGIEYRATSEEMLERMSGDPNPEALRVLASVVAPPRGYARGGMRAYTSLSPLNHLVDAIPPESETARQFSLICKRIAEGTATPEDWQLAHDWLVVWRDNDDKLKPQLSRSEITTELIPVSQSLYQVAEIGLRALESLHNSQTLPADVQKQDLESLASAEKPQAVLLLMVAPSVELLVKSAKVH